MEQQAPSPSKINQDETAQKPKRTIFSILDFFLWGGGGGGGWGGKNFQSLLPKIAAWLNSICNLVAGVWILHCIGFIFFAKTAERIFRLR